MTDLKTTDRPTVPYIVYEGEMARAERHIKRLAIAVAIAVVGLIVSNVNK